MILSYINSILFKVMNHGPHYVSAIYVPEIKFLRQMQFFFPFLFTSNIIQISFQNVFRHLAILILVFISYFRRKECCTNYYMFNGICTSK